MPRLLPCPSCHAHVRPSEPSCPHCGVQLSRQTDAGARLGAGAAVVMGLALTGCPSSPTTHPMDDAGDDAVGEPEYGVPDTSEPGQTVDPGTESVDEPEYGVPDTDAPGQTVDHEMDFVDEPEYGVPDTGEPAQLVGGGDSGGAGA